MKKKKSTRKKTRGVATKKRDNNNYYNETLSLEELLTAAETAMSGFDVEKSIKLYTSAASLLRSGRTTVHETRERQLVQVLEQLGEGKVSIGDTEGARADFEEAINLLIDDGTMWYHETTANLQLYVGQLSMSEAALEAYLKGITSIKSCLGLAEAMEEETQPMEQDDNDDDNNDNNSNDNESNDAVAAIKKKLSGAYCTVSELYLTDLCYNDNAEQECELYLAQALEIIDKDGEPMIDALQTVASLRLSQQERQKEATSYILRAYNKMKVGCESLATLVGVLDDDTNGRQESSMGNLQQEERAMELQNVDDVNKLPEYEFRCETAKILLECASLEDGEKRQQCHSAAIAVLGSLLAQNDEVIEIWFLMGCAFLGKNQSNEAKHYLQRCAEMLSETEKGLKEAIQYSNDNDEQEELQAEMEELQVKIEEVNSKLASLGAVQDDNEEEPDAMDE